jgi:hypothetical protein
VKHGNLLGERKGATRGLLILVARLTARNHKTIFSLCHYFAIMKPSAENESRHLGQNEMAGLKGKSGPPGNMNAFKHGLAAIQKRREESIITEHEESVRQQILDGLIADKGGDDQVSTATRILAEVIASDAAWLMVFNGAIDHIIQNNPKARQNPRGLSQLDGYKRGLVNSLTGNLQKFGLDRVAKVEPWKKFSVRAMKPARIRSRIVQKR